MNSYTRRQWIRAAAQGSLAVCSSSLLFAQANTQRLRFVGAEGSPPVSSVNSGVVEGLLQELVNLLGQVNPNFTTSLELFPWSRAQWMVENGVVEGFCTYPSRARQEYATFTDEPAFVWDYGNLIYHKDNPNAQRIKQAKSFEDLKNLTVVGQYNSDWEDDNIPAYIKRDKQATHEAALKTLLQWKKGDFMVMNPLEATYFARQLGREADMKQQRVSFISDSLLPFHFGIGKASANAQSIVDELNRVIESDEFRKRKADIMYRYENPS